jgi:glucose-6-phosphate-specific signal transduction histidine kinase
VPTLSDEEQLVIFRVTQESLSNIAKHASASDVDVELSFVGRTVLRVRDDAVAAAHLLDRQPPHEMSDEVSCAQAEEVVMDCFGGVQRMPEQADMIVDTLTETL